jgi:hypothetical protein
MSAIVITPAYANTHPSLDRVMSAAGLPWLRVHQHSDLPRIRSVLIEQGLASGAERLILVDADTIPTAQALRELAESAEVTPSRALWGMYPLREGDRWSVNPEDPAEASQAVDAGRRFPILTGGLGLCAIHRDSLERLGATLPAIAEDTGATWRPFCVPLVRGARYYADDGSLCLRLTESGTELWCDPRLRAGHAATTILTAPRG